MLRLCGRKRRELFGRRFRLMLRFPLRERFAVDALARGVLVDCYATLGGGLSIPVGEAVATEASADHQVDVLHVASGAQVVEQMPECCGFQFDVEFSHGIVPDTRRFERRVADVG